MVALYKKNNILYIDYLGILSVAEYYYIYLYERKESNKKAKNRLLSIMKKKINVFAIAKMTRPIKRIKVINVIKRTFLGKSLNMDGLLIKILKVLIVKIYNINNIIVIAYLINIFCQI